MRDEEGRIHGIAEERDIQSETDESKRQLLLNLTEGNCPLYAIRASTLRRCLEDLTNENAQQQYYLTDIIQSYQSRRRTDSKYYDNRRRTGI